MQAPTDCVAYVAAPQQQHQPPPPATRHSQQGAAPQHGEGGQSRRRTTALRHTAGCGPRPGPAPAAARPAAAAPHDTFPANNNRPEEMRTSCSQQQAPPQIDAAKMSPRISICPEPVLAAHAQRCCWTATQHHVAGIWPHPGVSPAADSPANTTPRNMTPTNISRMLGRQMSNNKRHHHHPVVSNRPLHRVMQQ